MMSKRGEVEEEQTAHASAPLLSPLHLCRRMAFCAAGDRAPGPRVTGGGRGGWERGTELLLPPPAASLSAPAAREKRRPKAAPLGRRKDMERDCST